jgi:hypothetical protein
MNQSLREHFQVRKKGELQSPMISTKDSKKSKKGRRKTKIKGEEACVIELLQNSLNIPVSSSSISEVCHEQKLKISERQNDQNVKKRSKFQKILPALHSLLQNFIF